MNLKVNFSLLLIAFFFLNSGMIAQTNSRNDVYVDEDGSYAMG